MAIKLMRIIARLNVGGPAIHCLSLSNELTHQGFDTVLVIGAVENGELEVDDRFFYLNKKTYKIIRLPFLRRSLSFIGDLLSFLQLIQIIWKEKPQIVHTHTAKAGFLGRVAALLTRVPVIVHTFHGHVFNGYFSPFFTKIICLIERILAHKTNAIITLSPKLKQELTHQYQIATSSQVHVIPLGRDLTPFFQASQYRGSLYKELGITNASIKLFGIIGRLIPIKNHKLFIEALTLLKSSAEWRAVIVGEGPCLQELKDQVSVSELNSKIHFLGWRPNLVPIYADLHFSACTSLNEGTPLSIIESFASSCPVIATSVGGVPDMFTDREGILVESSNAPLLAKAIDLFLEDTSLRDQAAVAARKTAENYHLSYLCDRTAELYKKLLGKSDDQNIDMRISA